MSRSDLSSPAVAEFPEMQAELRSLADDFWRKIIAGEPLDGDSTIEAGGLGATLHLPGGHMSVQRRGGEWTIERGITVDHDLGGGVMRRIGSLTVPQEGPVRGLGLARWHQPRDRGRNLITDARPGTEQVLVPYMDVGPADLTEVARQLSLMTTIRKPARDRGLGGLLRHLVSAW